MVIEIIGFIIGLAELYLLHRNHIVEFPSGTNERTHVYVFIEDESVETSRISLLSLSHLRGSPTITVLCPSERSEIKSLCSEFGFTYSSKTVKFDSACDHYLFTNGHTIIYPDAILVGVRRLGKKISYVELNHSIYSSHALGNNNVSNDVSRASLLATASGSFAVPIYTGGPILVQQSRCDLKSLEIDDDSSPTFSSAVAVAASSGHSGTITSHPCCECMSHNEIDHNISSRTARVKVSRKLKKHPQYVDTAKGIVRRYIGWYYMRFFWLRSVSYLLASVFVLGALDFGLPNQILSPRLFVLFAGAQVSSYMLSRFQGDYRRPIERLRDSVLDSEAFVHAVALKVKANGMLSHYRIRFVPLYISLVLLGSLIRFVREASVSSVHDINFWNSFYTLTFGGLVIIALYRAMNRYLSARQRAFARRNVSITGSSSYESMWIVDLTHRGAAYISDSQLDIGDETLLVFRIPTMTGDSLITVVGKVTYCGPRGSQYQVGVAFKELSQQALDDLTLYCSVIYPYRQARNIEDTLNLTEDSLKTKNDFHDPRRNSLSIALYGFVLIIIIGLLGSAIPVDNRGGIGAPINLGSTKLAEIMPIKNENVINPEQYNFTSLVSTAGSGNLVTISSSLYIDADNDGKHNKSEKGIAGVTVSLFDAKNNIVNSGPDGILGNEDDSSEGVVTNQAGEFAFRLINSGSYYVQIANIPHELQLSDASQKSVGIVQTESGYRSKIFVADEKNNGKISDLNIGFTTKFDLTVTQEILGQDPGGFVPGDVVNIQAVVKNAGPDPVRSGFMLNTFLGDDFEQENIEMVQTSGFSPCGFSGLKLECVGTSELAAGESRVVEFSVTSHVSPSSSSDRRLIRSTVVPSRLDHMELENIPLFSNNNAQTIFPVGQSTSIGDRVFFDDNANGIQDSGEQGIEGIRVGLLQFKDKNGDGIQDPGETPEIAHDVSDANGYFGVSSGKTGFQNLTPGAQYSLRFSKIPKNFEVTTFGVGRVGSNFDSDVDPTTKSTKWAVVGNGVVDTSRDLGLISKRNHLSNIIFDDKNKNNKYDQGENVFASQDMRLFQWVDVNNDQVQDSDETSDLPISIVRSGADGRFDFGAIRDGLATTYYIVETDLPQGYGLSSDNGQKKSQQDGTRIRSKPTTSSDFGTSGLMALTDNGSTISGNLWADFSVDAIFNSTENGVFGLQVYLVSKIGKIVATTKTDRNGMYQFNNVASGKYLFGVSSKTIPTGFVVGGIGNEHIARNVLGRKNSFITVEANTPIVMRDLALIPKSEIYGIVFDRESSKKNHLRALSNSEISIMRGNEIIATTISNKNGYFALEGLLPGNYTMKYEDTKGISKIEFDVVPGIVRIRSVVPSSARIQIVANAISGQFNKVAFTKQDNWNLRLISIYGAIFAAIVAIGTLVQRRKLISKNN